VPGVRCNSNDTKMKKLNIRILVCLFNFMQISHSIELPFSHLGQGDVCQGHEFPGHSLPVSVFNVSNKAGYALAALNYNDGFVIFLNSLSNYYKYSHHDHGMYNLSSFSNLGIIQDRQYIYIKKSCGHGSAYHFFSNFVYSLGPDCLTLKGAYPSLYFESIFNSYQIFSSSIWFSNRGFSFLAEYDFGIDCESHYSVDHKIFTGTNLSFEVASKAIGELFASNCPPHRTLSMYELIPMLTNKIPKKELKPPGLDILKYIEQQVSNEVLLYKKAFKNFDSNYSSYVFPGYSEFKKIMNENY